MRAVGAVATSPFLYLTWFGELPGKSCCFQNLNTSCVADVCFLLSELFFILLAKFYASQKMELFLENRAWRMLGHVPLLCPPQMDVSGYHTKAGLTETCKAADTNQLLPGLSTCKLWICPLKPTFPFPTLVLLFWAFL